MQQKFYVNNKKQKLNDDAANNNMIMMIVVWLVDIEFLRKKNVFEQTFLELLKEKWRRVKRFKEYPNK